MTSLLDAQRYPAAEFGALHHKRRRVEESFKRIKHRLTRSATGLTRLAFQIVSSLPCCCCYYRSFREFSSNNGVSWP